jgi:hypothetical protein
MLTHYLILQYIFINPCDPKGAYAPYAVVFLLIIVAEYASITVSECSYLDTVKPWWVTAAAAFWCLRKEVTKTQRNVRPSRS